MEAVMRAVPRDHQTLVPSKQNRNKTPKKNTRSKFISSPSAGLLNPPPLHSLHPHQHAHYYALPLSSNSSSHQQNHHQPPLLPLPTISPTHHHHHPLLSPTPRSKKNTTKDKSKPTTRDVEVKKKATQSFSEFFTPKQYLPVSVTSSSLRSTTTTCDRFGNENDNIAVFSSSVFSVLSPPPSSLPLPKFCMRSKLGCNVESGGGFDAGATQDLRRVLRLQ